MEIWSREQGEKLSATSLQSADKRKCSQPTEGIVYAAAADVCLVVAKQAK